MCVCETNIIIVNIIICELLVLLTLLLITIYIYFKKNKLLIILSLEIIAIVFFRVSTLFGW